jgi:thiol-disulfide isomerase/thioredoxin
MLKRLHATAVLLLAATPAFAQQVTVRGKVLDAAGKPAAGVEVANFWDGAGGRMKAYQSTTTSADGTFSAKVPGWMQEAPLMVLDKDRKLGGLALVKPTDGAVVPPITLGPLVRVKGKLECKELDRLPPWSNVYVITGKNARVLQCVMTNAEFSVLLPPGKYTFNCYGQDVKGVNRPVEVPADKPELDLGAIDLPATEIAKHVGKAPPAWHVKDARGVRKDVTVADFKGKWVLIDFWGHWCGPCVARMPDLIDIYEMYADHRDKFEIIAFHDSSVDTFADMDGKLKPIKASLWSGRDLPFPVLLDDGRQTEKAYSIQRWPTAVLIDPDGKLVGEVDASKLEEKLPKLPAGVRAGRALDKMLSYGVDEPTLTEFGKIVLGQTLVPVKLDLPALKAKGVDPDAKVPLTLAGAVSLRSWFNLVLAADGLTVRPDGDALLVTPGPRPPESKGQLACAEHLKAVLDKPLDFDLKGKTLVEVCQYFEGATRENFVLDPAARRAGAVDPKAVVTGSAKGQPLRDGLKTLLDPLKLEVVARDEVIVITPKK